ncbi:hypothetical protein BDW68DRAFT_155950 [Aspergillus falconensis]
MGASQLVTIPVFSSTAPSLETPRGGPGRKKKADRGFENNIRKPLASFIDHVAIFPCF